MPETGNNIPGVVEFEFLDETLDINSTESYHLSIQFGLDGLSFCILDGVQKKYVALKNYPGQSGQASTPEWMKSVIQEDPFLNRPYKSVAISHISERSTLVPDPLFKTDNLEDYFSFNLHLDSSEIILSHRLNRAESWCLFPFPKNMHQLFHEQFPNVQFCHHSIPFLDHALRTQKTGDYQQSVHVNLHPAIFDLAATSMKSLEVYNCYPYQHVNDVMYYVLNVFEQLDLPPADTRLVLSGKVTRQSSLYENLRRYIRKIDFAKRDRDYTYSYTFEKVPEHAYLNLLNLYTCAS